MYLLTEKQWHTSNPCTILKTLFQGNFVANVRVLLLLKQVTNGRKESWDVHVHAHDVYVW